MRSFLTALLAGCFCLPLVGGEESAKELFEFAKAKAEKGDASAQVTLGLMYEYGRGVAKNDVEAVKWYRKAAEQGDADAQIYLGSRYGYGRGVAKDDAEAVKWYRKAAEQGVAVAQLYLGLMYAKGQGVLEDRVTALVWWSIAAANGDKNAKSNKIKIAKKMTPEQIAQAQALSKEMTQKNPKLLK